MGQETKTGIPQPRPTGELLDGRGGELFDGTTPPLGNSVTAHMLGESTHALMYGLLEMFSRPVGPATVWNDGEAVLTMTLPLARLTFTGPALSIGLDGWSPRRRFTFKAFGGQLEFTGVEAPHPSQVNTFQ